MTRGERIKRARESRGLSAPQIAAEIGISKQAYYRWERDAVGFIKPDHMARFCVITGFSQGWLAKGKGPERLADMDDNCLAIFELCATMSDETKKQVLDFARFKAAR